MRQYYPLFLTNQNNPYLNISGYDVLRLFISCPGFWKDRERNLWWPPGGQCDHYQQRRVQEHAQLRPQVSWLLRLKENTPAIYCTVIGIGSTPTPHAQLRPQVSWMCFVQNRKMISKWCFIFDSLISDCDPDLGVCVESRKFLSKYDWGLAKWLVCLTVNAEVATVLDSISASSDTVKSEGGGQMKQCWIK